MKNNNNIFVLVNPEKRGYNAVKTRYNAVKTRYNTVKTRKNAKKRKKWTWTLPTTMKPSPTAQYQ